MQSAVSLCLPARRTWNPRLSRKGVDLHHSEPSLPIAVKPPHELVEVVCWANFHCGQADVKPVAESPLGLLGPLCRVQSIDLQGYRPGKFQAVCLEGSA